MDFEISIPEEQHGRETFTLRFQDGREQTIHYYDYGEVYSIPGLALRLRRDHFHSYSDWILSAALCNVLESQGVSPREIRLLDFGAGSGCFGAEARRQGFGAIVGVDVVPKAKTEAERQYPDAYDEYLVMDIRDADAQQRLARWELNTLVAVNALGDEHVSSEIFQAALACIQKPGWIVFNMMSDSNETIDAQEHAWFRDQFEVVDRFRFFNRTSLDGRKRYFNEGLICRW